MGKFEAFAFNFLCHDMLYRLFYYRIFGGATAFRGHVFRAVNGFSNEFYGWGGEDDDMLNR